MIEFKSYLGFLNFAESIRREWRFTRSAEQQEFLSAVLDSSHSRRKQIAAGTSVWRAQVGNDWRSGDDEDNACPFPPQRMKPLAYQASEGRANPKGIPYLYTATHHDTAIAEVRPWVGALVSVAELRVQRELTIVNCISPYPRLRVRATEPSAPERERSVWKDIDNAFSRPVTPHEQIADYVPTQVLAECFRSEGLDGIRYKSSVGDGTNIVFFDLNVAEVVTCGLFQVNWMKLTSIEASNPYVIQKPSS